jgi:hypothetical protein
MKITLHDPPRRFDADGTGRFIMTDAGRIELSADEQVTFIAHTGSEYDVARKVWGYYATPSLNSRLPAKGLRPALVLGDGGRFYLCLVEKGCEASFAEYLQRSGMRVIGWLDDAAILDRIQVTLREG